MNHKARKTGSKGLTSVGIQGSLGHARRCKGMSRLLCSPSHRPTLLDLLVAITLSTHSKTFVNLDESTVQAFWSGIRIP
jgi:hypothetical protein